MSPPAVETRPPRWLAGAVAALLQVAAAPGGLAVACVAALSSCTALSDFEIEQCSSDAECNMGSGGVMRCESARCVAGCRDNRGCVTFDPRSPICPVPGAACTSLTSAGDECYANSTYDDASMGPLDATQITVMGAFASSLRSSTWLSTELAVDEISQFNATSASPQRPVLAVLCSSAAGDMPTAMEHLVHDLGARVLVASLESEAMDVALALPKSSGQALLLSPYSVPVDDEQAPRERDLLWRLGGLQSDVVAGYPTLLRRTLTRLAEAGYAEPKMVSIVGPSREDSALTDAVEAALGSNGINVRDLAAFDRYRRLSLSDRSPEAREGVLQELVTYAPQLVLVFLGGTFANPIGLEQSSFVVTLDAALSANGAGQPVYLIGPRSKPDAGLQDWAAATPSFRARALGVDADRALDGSVFAAVTGRFDAAFPKAKIEARLSLSAPVYDAVYYLSYASAYAAAAFAQDGTPLYPAMLVDGLQRATDPVGSSVEVGPGPQGLEGAMASLAQYLPIDVVGSSGPADFDRAQHARPSAARAWCWSNSGELVDLATLDAISSAGMPCAQEVLEDAP
jgi:hypothetical protein